MSATEDRITDLLRRHPLVDGHNDLPWVARTSAGDDWSRLDVDQRRHDTHTDLVRLAEGGVSAQFWSVYVPSTLAEPDAVVATLEQIDTVHRLVARHPEKMALARTPDELKGVVASGRIASMLGAEGGHSIGSSLGALRALHALGVRYLTLTHNDNTPWADSATDTAVHHGLSDFGEEVVREMNRVGMLVDLSHVSADTMRDALRVSEVPVIFSHSSARAVCDVPRNVPDDVLTSLATKGGVCMVTFVPQFVSSEFAAWLASARETARADGLDPDELGLAGLVDTCGPFPPVGVDDVVAHVEHVREVAGVEHIGLGGDYDGTEMLPSGLEDVSGYPRLLAALAGRGWSDDELARLAGGNLLRTWRDADAGAERLRAEREPSLRRAARN